MKDSDKLFRREYTMHKKALTVAIAGALAIPMAAHAVDVTIGGWVNPALFITDSDDASSTSAEVKDNGSSGSRIWFTGEGEMMDGGSAGVLLEYAAPIAKNEILKMRFADVWFEGSYGKVSIGRGNQGGEGSVYHGAAAVTGTGHGQDSNGVASDYYTSLDGGDDRNERLRYDSPAVGPVSASVSVGNGDQVSAGIKLSQDFGGTSFTAGIGTVQWGGSDKSTLSASAGVTLPSGVSLSGAWGTGKDHAGEPIGAMREMPNTPEKKAVYKDVWTHGFGTNNDTVEPLWKVHATKDGEVIAVFVQSVEPPTSVTTSTRDARTDKEIGGTTVEIVPAATFRPRNFDADVITHQATLEASSSTDAQIAEAEEALAMLFEGFACAPVKEAEKQGGADTPEARCMERLYSAGTPEGKDGTPAVAAVPTTTDPSFFQVAVSYAFGDTSVGVSWYQSSDMYNEGSELTAIGAGVNHNLPKIGTNVYVAAQNYSVKDGAVDSDDTVIMIGARVKF